MSREIKIDISRKKQKFSKLKIGDFLIGKTLGSGSFGKVKAGRHILTGHDVAIKILNRDKIKSLDVVEKVRREIQFLKLFDHPHIIKLYQVISTPTDFFMIMEYISGGELFDYIVSNGRLNELESRRFFQQIISGVDYCHHHHIIHRDLKPENLLLDSKFNVKIADFGLSNMMNDGEFLKTSCGSPNYAAPEVISGKLYVGPEVDIWSCGVILFAFLCGFLPFEDEHIPSLFRKIKNGSFFIPDYVSDLSRELIEGMIKVDVLQRWSMERIKNHEWFKTDMPSYMFPEYSELTKNIDTDVIDEICLRFSVTENDVINSLSSSDSSDQLAIAYKLICSNRNIYKNEPNININNDHGYNYNVPYSSQNNTNNITDSQENNNSSQTKETTQNTRKLLRNSANYQRWHLGIRSKTDIVNIMRELFKVLLELNMEWNIRSKFNIIARALRNLKYVYINIKIFKTSDFCFLVDFACIPNDASSANSVSTINKSQNDSIAFNSNNAIDDVINSDSRFTNQEVMTFLDICSEIIISLTC